MGKISEIERICSSIGALFHVIFVALPRDLWHFVFSKHKYVQDQIIVITGAASGIGQQLAIDFSTKLGAKVAILDVDNKGAERTVAKILDEGSNAKSWFCDIRDIKQLNACAKQIEIEFGPINIVICNAAVLFYGSITDVTDTQLQQSLDVNVLGTINTIRAFLKSMEQQNSGHIVAISSIAGFFGEANGIAYCPTKFAVRGIMESLQMELIERGFTNIHVTTVCPYFTRTPMILNANMRPTSTWLPFMSVQRCSREIIDAILREKQIAFVPHYMSILAALKNVLPWNVQLAGRKYMNCRYEPCNSKVPDDEIKLFNSVDFFQKLNITTKCTIAIFYATLLLVLYNPDWLGQFGWPGHALNTIGRNYSWLPQVTNLFVLIAHIAEAIYAAKLCAKFGFSFRATIMWTLQTVILGMPSLRLLSARKKAHILNKKNSQ